MKIFSKILLIILFSVSIENSGLSQINKNKTKSPVITVSKSIYFDVSPRLDKMINLAKGDNNPLKEYHEVENKFIIHPKDNGLDRPDPLANIQKKYKIPKSESLIQDVNVEGVSNLDGVAPPDTQGDVSPNYYMQCVNGHTVITDKSGNVVKAAFPTSDFWSGTGYDDRDDGDAVILWDEHAQRWLVTQFYVPSSGTQYLLVAVSKTSDPTGSYYRYAFDYTDMPDYPKWAIWPDGYYVGANGFDVSSGNFTGAIISVVDRSAMIAGNSSVTMITFRDPDLWAIFPTDADAFPAAGTPCYFITDQVDYTTGNNKVYLYKLHTDWNKPSNSTFTLDKTFTVADYGLFSSDTEVPQPGTNQKLDLLHYRIMYRPYFRHFQNYDDIVMARTIDDGGVAAIRWYEFRNYGKGWSIYQQGTYNPGDGLWRWMPSIAMNKYGDIAIGYSVSNSSNKYPSIRCVARRSGDPLGVMTTNENEFFTGQKSQDANNLSRWGDYSMMSIEPADGYSFWYTNEYSNGGWNWRTRIIKFHIIKPSSPTVTSISDNHLYKDRGKQLTITGSNLKSSIFTIGGIQGDVVSNDGNTAVVNFPPGNYTDDGTLIVTNVSGTDNSHSISVKTRNIIPVVAGASVTSDNHPSIQSAVNGLHSWYGATSFDSGDLPGAKTILVHSGTYNEDVNVDVGLNPSSSNKLIFKNNVGDIVTVDASGETNAFYLNSIDNVVVQGFTLENATQDNVFINGNNITVSYNKISGSSSGSGVKIQGGTNVTISNNLIFSNNRYGIYDLSANNIIKNNTIDNNGYSFSGNKILTYTFSGSVSIPDNGCSSNNYALATISVPDNVTVTKVRVLNMNITHTYDSDLNIYLLHPDGTTVELSTGNGGSGQNYTNTNFDDNASTSITSGSAPFTGTFKPEGSLSDLNGKSSSGNWSLKVCDDASYDTGTITDWTLEISGDVGAAIYVADVPVTVQNNILVAKSGNDNFYALQSPGNQVSSDYNIYYSTNTNVFDYNGTQDNIGPKGSNDKLSDPLFVGSGDYHIQSDKGSYHSGEWPPLTTNSGTWTNDANNSPALDAGNPSDPYSNEPSSGNRINAGAYGNTVQASKTFTGLNITWTGNVDKNWQNAGNWDLNVVPTINDNVTIPSGLTNYPLINNGTTTALCNDLTIENSASVTIAPNGQMTVNGSITNNAGTGGLLIQSNSTGTGSLIQNSSSPVDATVQRFLASPGRSWHILTAPISNADIASVFPSTDNLYYYDESTNDFWLNNQYGAGSVDGWTPISSGTMNPKKGYLYSFFQTTLNFAGTLNNSDAANNISIQYTNHGTTAPNGVDYKNLDGWNLIANPFTSAIDWTKVDASAANLYDAIYVWDAANKTYKSYVNGTDSYDGASTNGGSQFIPAMQGFFVKVNEALGTNATLSIPAAARVHNSQNFWKNYSKIQNNFLCLNISSNGYTDQTVVRFTKNATYNVDNRLDAYKLFTYVQNVPQIYTNGISGNTEYSINTLPLNISTIAIPLQIIPGGTEYSISVSKFNFLDYNVFLKDNDNDNLSEINQNSVFKYTKDGNENSGRFELIFEPKNLLLNQKIIDSKLTIYPNPNNGKFILRVINESNEYEIKIIAAGGKKIFEHKFFDHQYHSINLGNVPQGIYILWLIDNKHSEYRKIVIK